MPSAPDPDFVANLRRAIDAIPGNQTDKGRRIAEAARRPKPYSQQVVGRWRSGEVTPSLAALEAIERLAGLAPGALASHRGFVPAATVPALTVEDAIDADPELDTFDRELLKLNYRALVERNRRRGRGEPSKQ